MWFFKFFKKISLWLKNGYFLWLRNLKNAFSIDQLSFFILFAIKIAFSRCNMFITFYKMADSQKFPLAKFSLLYCSWNSTLVRFEKIVFFYSQNFPLFSGGIHKPELCCNRQGMKKAPDGKKLIVSDIFVKFSIKVTRNIFF